MKNPKKVVKNRVILNLIQDLRRLSLQLVNNLRGRFQIKFGMTPCVKGFTPNCHPELDSGSRRCFIKGFTLIELLVVVLIIGILAAIAVPQYQMAVGKAQFSTVKSVTRSVGELAYAYYLEHGTYVGATAEVNKNLPSGIGCNVWDETQQNYIACNKTIFNTLTYFYIKSDTRTPRLCLVYSTNTTDLANKLCQKETGKTRGTCTSTYCEYYY